MQARRCLRQRIRLPTTQRRAALPLQTNQLLIGTKIRRLNNLEREQRRGALDDCFGLKDMRQRCHVFVQNAHNGGRRARNADIGG